MICERMFRVKRNGEPDCSFYCRHPELIENYAQAIADTTQTWQAHHRLETHFSDGTERPRNAQLTGTELSALDMYYDRPPEELIFLTKEEHNKLHKIGTKRSEETKQKMSEARKGKLINHKSLSKKVLCVETGEIFESTRDAERQTGIRHDHISEACHGHIKTAGKYHWQFTNYLYEEKLNG